MAEGGKLVVYAALGGNVAVAVLKFVAFGFTASTAMLSEAIHSLIDSGDQALLLLGLHRSKRPPDPSHPFGYGMEIYFWTFTVALLIFSVGGLVSIYEGVQRILNPREGPAAWINYLVLGLSFVFEGGSLIVGWREYKRAAPEGVGVVRFVRRSKDPSLFTSLLEDSAALIGLLFAALGVAGGQAGLSWADGSASIAIGVLLVLVGAVLANETRSLIAGEAASAPVQRGVRAAVERDGRVDRLEQLRTLQVGPQTIIVAADLVIRPDLDRAEALDAIQDLTRSIRGSDDRIADVFLRRAEGRPAHGG